MWFAQWTLSYELQCRCVRDAQLAYFSHNGSLKKHFDKINTHSYAKYIFVLNLFKLQINKNSMISEMETLEPIRTSVEDIIFKTMFYETEIKQWDQIPHSVRIDVRITNNFTFPSIWLIIVSIQMNLFRKYKIKTWTFYLSLYKASDRKPVWRYSKNMSNALCKRVVFVECTRRGRSCERGHSTASDLDKLIFPFEFIKHYIILLI